MLRPPHTPPCSSLSLDIRCFAHTCLLTLELRINSPAYDQEGLRLSPEERYGILSKALFAWVNPVLIQGYTRILSKQDMPVLSQDMKPEHYRELMTRLWAQRSKPETKSTLQWDLLRCVRKPFFAAIIPRSFLILLRYCQPTLIKKTIRYVAAFPVNAEDGHGFWLVVAAVLIYVGLAVSTSAYQHRINRLKLVARSALIGLIHGKMMESRSMTYDDGEATTLMSTDADSLDCISEMAHEIWAQVVEVLIGIGLLAGQVGWIWPLPLFLIYCSPPPPPNCAVTLSPTQKAWNAATQDRIAATNSMLSAIKTVKMLGMQSNLHKRIEMIRSNELLAASRLRWVMVYYNASGMSSADRYIFIWEQHGLTIDLANALGIFSPAITLALYVVLSALRGNHLDTETAFTTMAILSIVTHPANMVVTIVPRAVAALSGFQRIQQFLVRPSLHPHREIQSEQSRGDRMPYTLGTQQPAENGSAARLCHVTMGHDQPLLSQINIDIPAGALTIISGPTGGGKVVPAEGSITVSTRQIVYCAQRLWLPNGSIKEAIYGATDLYNATHQEHELCHKGGCLTQDFGSLVEGDRTQMGSRGLNLSGGQRQRVTLARALFAKNHILLLDDVLSGLDGDTEQAVFDNILGAKGLLRRLKTTVILSVRIVPTLETDQKLTNGSQTWVDGHRQSEPQRIRGGRNSSYSGARAEPLFLSNETIRFNLDPDGLAPDDSIVLALTKTGLWPIFRGAPTSGDDEKAGSRRKSPVLLDRVGEHHAILDRPLDLFPELSLGQTQLFALSRALIKAATLRRRSGVRPVILLDEATSALDAATESAIYRIIDEELTAKGYTVIIVAHRLGMLQAYTRGGRDTVVSMANGKLTSVDSV
ncbi:oligomycin resistance ATP-dependent permease yor1 [Apiospora phragmitis]|uniref:Oligomycin resistance ATP-dependent permease yor1 n=1 Tax=Apiospora phragmitis TaxID=2905665 RepID=A0ABR1UV79_9PEZI